MTSESWLIASRFWTPSPVEHRDFTRVFARARRPQIIYLPGQFPITRTYQALLLRTSHKTAAIVGRGNAEAVHERTAKTVGIVETNRFGDALHT